MEAIILADRSGTRQRQVEPDLPKPMAPVARCIFFEILLNSLAHKGFSDVVLSMGFDDTPLGTGGARRMIGTSETTNL